MKKLLFILVMTLMTTGTFANRNYSRFKCTAHYTVVNEDGDVVWGPADVTANTCENAVKAARYFYFLATGDTSVY